MSVKNEVLAMVLAATILVSMFLISLPLVRADYYVDHASFPPDLPGDVNCDGKVDGRDITIVARAFGTHFGDGSGRWNPLADVNDDGKVDGRDITSVAKLFGKSYNTSAEPIAYSTSFEFDVPSTGVSGVWYYMLVRVYMPSGFASNTCFLVGNADAGIQDVIIDTKLVYPNQVSGPFSILLGNLSLGYHLFELEYLGSADGGSINFTVQTMAGEAVWLDRFRICVPNYSSSMIEYTVTTDTYFPTDTYYLGGYADKYIDNVWIDGTMQVWSDWEWNVGSYGSIYGWGDGFMYPLDQAPLEGTHTVQFTFGNNATGLLDFQYFSQSGQAAEIGSPKFYASAVRNLGNGVTLNNVNLYGGSTQAGLPGISLRNVTVQSAYDLSYVGGNHWINTKIQITVGNWWATWALGPASPRDVGIPLNVTVANFASDIPTGYKWPAGLYFWWVGLRDYNVDVYSFPNLTIGGLEDGQGQSSGKIAPGYTIFMDLLGGSILTTAGLSSGMSLWVGSIVGNTLQGLSTLIDYSEGQSVSDYTTTIEEDNHVQLQANEALCIQLANDTGGSCSDLLFLGLSPNGGKTCGLTEVVLSGTLVAEYFCFAMDGYHLIDSYVLANVGITLAIPWFIWQ